MKAGKDYIGLGCGALIENDNGEVLLILRGEKSRNDVGTWAQPGGKVDFKEKTKAAVHREIKEELDIDISVGRFLCFTEHFPKDKDEHWIAISYSAKIDLGVPKIMEPKKIADFRWFSLDNLPENLSDTTVDSTNRLKELYGRKK